MKKSIYTLALMFAFMMVSFSYAGTSHENSSVKNAIPGFTVQGTKIIGPDGNEFIVKGTNVTGQGSFWDNTTIAHKDMIIDCWKFNTIRIYFKLFTNSHVSWQDMLDVIDTFTAAKIVVIVEAHDKVGSYYEGAELDQLKQKYRELANRYVNNPYVWFDIANEPGSTNVDKNKWLTMYQEVIKVIRDEVGNDNIIMVEGGSWGQDAGDWGTGNVDPNRSAILRWGNDVKTFGGKSYENIVMSIHVYDQFRSGGVARIENFIQAIWDAGHALVVGEWGNWNNNDIPMAMDAFAGVLAKGSTVGRIVWHWQGGDRNRLVVGDNSFVSNGSKIDDCENPTNLTPLGAYVWRDNHNLYEVQDPSTSVETLNSLEKVQIFPNPSRNEMITINLNATVSAPWSFTISDMSGRIVVSRSIDFGNEYKLNTNSLNRGTYFLRIHTDKSSATKKLFVM
jgi:mannan endo-1,4-beta-mannosidase